MSGPGRWKIGGGFEFVTDEGVTVEISGVRSIDSFQREDMRAFCRIETLDILAARDLKRGTSGKIHGRLRNFMTGELADEFCFGRWEVSAPALYSGHFSNSLLSAVIRLREL